MSNNPKVNSKASFSFCVQYSYFITLEVFVRLQDAFLSPYISLWAIRSFSVVLLILFELCVLALL